MLIQALCEYYDILEKDGKTAPDGYTKEKIDYLILLNDNGTIENVTDFEDYLVFPMREKSSQIFSYLIDHRAAYIFGIEYNTKSGRFEVNNEKHKAFVDKHIDFIKDIDTPIVNAFRKFLESWNPENEINNELVQKACGTKKNNGNNCAFCLYSNSNEELKEKLNEDLEIKKKYAKYAIQKKLEDSAKMEIAQCAVYGEMLPIARLHNNIQNLSGSMVSFNKSSYESYGKSQSYNSNISEIAMLKYTKSLSYIMAEKKNYVELNDLYIAYWAIDSNPIYSDSFSFFMSPDRILGKSSTSNAIESLLKDVCSGSLTYKQLDSISEINPNVSFYILGIKKNESRLAIVFLYRQKFGKLLQNIAQHQKDIQISNDNYFVSLPTISKALISSKTTDDKSVQAFIKELFISIILGTSYPNSLLYRVVSKIRVEINKKNININVKINKKNKKISINKVRAGIIKACLNRNSRLNHKEEEITMALNPENKDPAYLCGRLLAILEQLQKISHKYQIDQTIVDSYFSIASTKPDVIFPKLLKLSQFHLKKLNTDKYKNLIGDMLDSLDGQFPGRLSLQDQGKFILGYYQQREVLCAKKTKDEDNNILKGETENDQ